MADFTGVNLEILRQSIPLLKNAVAYEPIHKGYSTDKKLILHLQDDTKLLVRLFDLAEYDHKLVEYDYLKVIVNYGVKCSKPLAIGKLADLLLGYTILTYIEGKDASGELAKLTEAEQYQIGFETGQELFRIHHFKAPEGTSPWYERTLAKHRQIMAEYTELNVNFKDDSRVMEFIERHIHLMQDRPNHFQHEDIHPGNIIVKDRQFSGIIDFNRYDWGDPVYDFLKMGMFGKGISVPFSIGQVNGYHHPKEPDEFFWKLYALYLAISMFSSVVWVWNHVHDEKESLLVNLAIILEDQNNFDGLKPTWYR